MPKDTEDLGQTRPRVNSYSEKLKDPRWQRKRLEIMQRDGFKCRDCDNSQHTLHVHHCGYAKGNPWETSGEMLLTLCDGCHQTRQSAEDEIKARFSVLLAKTSQIALRGLFSSIQDALSFEDSDYYEIVRLSVLTEQGASRWYRHAFYNPEFRPAFEEVIGFKVEKWVDPEPEEGF